MNLDFVKDMYIPIVLVACLIIGYILKRWIKDKDHKWIPTILVILGAVLACISKMEINLSVIVSGAFTGLASTGMHQIFKQLINPAINNQDKCNKENSDSDS